MSELKPPTDRRERILGFGAAGVGKSEMVLDVAQNVGGQVNVLDTDYAYSALLGGMDVDVALYECPDAWESVMDNIADVKRDAEVDDWLALDSVSPTWSGVQDWYAQQVFDEDLGDYFLKARMKAKDSKVLQPFEGFTDWNVINKQYAKLYREILSFKGHVLLTAEQTSVGDDSQMRQLFGNYGVRPAGQKRLAHIPHTVLLLTKTKVGEYEFTTIKDRKRPEVEKATLAGGFSHEYLRKIAGWS